MLRCDTSRSRRLSITAVKRAYQLLESQGPIEGRPKSGYFVRVRGAEIDPACVLPRLMEGETPDGETDISRIVPSTMKLISMGEVARRVTWSATAGTACCAACAGPWSSGATSCARW